MAISSLELSTATRIQRVARLQGLSEDALKRHAVRAANERDLMALWELVEAHLALRGASGIATSRHTLRAYRRGIEELLVMWQGENLLRPSRDAGNLYVQRLLAGERQAVLEHDPPRAKRGRRVKPGPLSKASVSLRVAAGRSLYDALAWAGAADVDPFRDVRLGRPRPDFGQSASGRVYSANEMIELLAAAGDQQDLVLLLLGSHAGLRVSEMLRLEWTDVDLTNGELLVRGGKGGKTAAVLLSPRLKDALAKYKRLAASEASLAPHDGTVLELRSQYGVYNRLRRICLRAGVEFKGVHALRHTAGTRLYHQTGDLGQVQDHLRHATLDMARRYARSDRRRLRESLEGWE
ncbi:MAG TPA: tyrosine-type recombinase/integrase [Trueperaceae bacterium]|nr:tyrosine-type recombinase/integrase [Trueperaceae bacterium]